MQTFLKFSIVILCTLLNACGGGGSPTLTILSGKFIDAPVSGLGYTCSGGNGPSHTGFTDVNGIFSYENGQECKFSVGNISLGSISKVPTDGIVTPYDVAGVSRSAAADPGVTAIAQFLQSINSSGNNQIITISNSTTQALNNAPSTSLISQTAGVASQSTLLNLIKLTASDNGNKNSVLVSQSDAINYLRSQMSSNGINLNNGLVSTSTPVTLTSITLSATNQTTPIGVSDQMIATGNYSDGSTQDLTSKVSWTTTSSGNFSSSTYGLFVGKTAGAAMVTASYGNISTNYYVEVTPAILQTISIIPNAPSVVALEKIQLDVIGNFSDGSNTTVNGLTWLLSNNLATIDSSGNITAGANAGTVLITASSGTVQTNAILTIVPPDVISVIISSISNTIQIGFSTVLNAIENFSNNTQQLITSYANWIVSTSAGSSGAASIFNLNSQVTLLGNSVGQVNVQANYNGKTSNNLLITVTPPPVDPNQIFSNSAQMLPNLSDKFNNLCGSSVEIQTVITANILGHKDGKKDLVAGLYCMTTAGAIVNTPTPGGLIVLTQQQDGSFIDDTQRIFGVPLISVGGGVPFRGVALDLNGDGYDEVFFAVTGEDGRNLPQGYTGYNRKNVVLTSSANGSYSNQLIGLPGYNNTVQIVNGPNGYKDILTTSIGYGGSNQAFRLLGNQWVNINDYDGGPALSSSFYNYSNPVLNVNSAIGSNSNATGLSLYRQTGNQWNLLSNWNLPVKSIVNYNSWNGQPGTMSIFTISGNDYGFVSFGDNCRIKRQAAQDSSIFALPSQKIVGGYSSGRILTESNPSDFSNALIIIGFEESSGSLIQSTISFRNFITNQNFFNIKCIDFNGDGFDDLIVNNWGFGQKPNFYLQENGSSFDLIDPSRIPAPSSDFNGAIAIYEDIDGDGIKDILYYPINGLANTNAKAQFQIFKGIRSISNIDKLP